MTAADQTDSAELLTRVEWLTTHGFGRNPFPFNAFDGKTDLILDNSYCTFARTTDEWDNLIRGSFREPGCRFILACSGGGKTSLRQQLKREFESDMSFPTLGAGKGLVVEYVDHNYDAAHCASLFHVHRIRRLVRLSLLGRSQHLSVEDPHNWSEGTGNHVEARAQLRRDLTEYFSAEELKTLCFDFGIDYDDLPGEDKSAKARELITYLKRRSRISDLIKACYSERPQIPWGQGISALGNTLEQRRDGLIENNDLGQGPLPLLERMVTDCRAQGFSGVCVLVDNIEPSQDTVTTSMFQRILPLMRDTDILSMDGVIFKFLLPAELNRDDRRKLPTGHYPLYQVVWDREKLERVLRKRLAECLADSVRGPQSPLDSQGLMHLRELCADEWSGAVDSVFIEFGLWAGQPRAMWQLGHYLMMEHFCQAKRAAADLIKLRSLWEAIERLQSEVQLQLDSGPYDVRERIMGLLKK